VTLQPGPPFPDRQADHIVEEGLQQWEQGIGVPLKQLVVHALEDDGDLGGVRLRLPGCHPSLLDGEGSAVVEDDRGNLVADGAHLVFLSLKLGTFSHLMMQSKQKA
jgi:hypothetical protein